MYKHYSVFFLALQLASGRRHKTVLYTRFHTFGHGSQTFQVAPRLYETEVAASRLLVAAHLNVYVWGGKTSQNDVNVNWGTRNTILATVSMQRTLYTRKTKLRTFCQAWGVCYLLTKMSASAPIPMSDTHPTEDPITIVVKFSVECINNNYKININNNVWQTISAPAKILKRLIYPVQRKRKANNSLSW